MKTLFILNDGPYGSERSYNGLRLAGALGKSSDNEIRVFLIGDAVTCSKAGQKVPQGFYNIELMVNRVVRGKGQVGCAAVAWTRARWPQQKQLRALIAAAWKSLRSGLSGPTR